MQFNKIECNFGANNSSATITLNSDEIKEILGVFRDLGVKSQLRSNLYLLSELLTNGTVDKATFDIYKILAGEN